MIRVGKKLSQTVGLPPGTPVLVGEEEMKPVKMFVFDYDAAGVQEREIKNIEDCFVYKDKPTVTWINIDGISQVDVIQKVNDHFGIHPLVVEDILNTTQRPIVEDFEDYLYIALKMIHATRDTGEVDAEHISIIVGPNYVISFQEKEGDVFDPIRDRLRNDKGRVRKMGADYLAYTLIDAIVDNYFLILEKEGDRIEQLEDAIEREATLRVSQELHQLKREMISLRKQIWPLREVINNLQKPVIKLFKKTTSVYLRDVYDHTIQIIDTIESYRDILAGLHDIYLTSISMRMNEIMKVLTIIATIFMPLTFIAGIYGMNFKFMPELESHWGYGAVLLLMTAVAMSMVLYFKKKRWL